MLVAYEEYKKESFLFGYDLLNKKVYWKLESGGIPFLDASKAEKIISDYTGTISNGEGFSEYLFQENHNFKVKFVLDKDKVIKINNQREFVDYMVKNYPEIIL